MQFIARNKLLRRTVITAGLGYGIYEADRVFNGRVLSRTLKTLWNGALVIYDLKFNINEGADWEKVHERVSNRILDVCTGNGGLYIKFGQQIAGMGHVLPPQYHDKFRVLYDDAPTVPYAEVEKLFIEEFGKTPDEIFSYFQRTPIASASIAQVHKGILKDGRKVAVKIQKPEIKTQVDVDLFMYKSLCHALEYIFKMPVAWSADYIVKHMKQELDFINEAKNSERAASEIAENRELSKQVYVPKVIWEHTSTRVLTGEWIDGVKFSDIDALRKTNYNLPHLMNTIVATFAYQIFFTGFLHCDPHPGNILVRPHPKNPKKPQIVLLDHGLYITESPKFRKEYCTLWKSLFTMDMKKVDAVCRSWGIEDSSVMAMATLQKPFNPNKAIHLDKISYRDVYEQQQTHKKNLQKFLSDTSKIPLELVFVGRNLNIVRGNNRYLGSPVNRIEIMASWALRGIEYDVTKQRLGFTRRVSYTLSQTWDHFLFRTTLLALSTSFYAWNTWKRIKRFLNRNAKFADDEYDAQTIKELKKATKDMMGVTIDETSFNA